jgi:hypothetical protein
MLTDTFNTHPNNNNNIGLHTFEHGGNYTYKLHQNSREQNLSSQKMWDNNKFGLHSFGCGEKLDQKSTSQLNNTKLVISKNVGQ